MLTQGCSWVKIPVIWKEEEEGLREEEEEQELSHLMDTPSSLQTNPLVSSARPWAGCSARVNGLCLLLPPSPQEGQSTGLQQGKTDFL